MSTLSIIILTKNEERDIEAAIQNAWQCADEVLVVDSGSTDRTAELAEKNGARVLFREWDNDFAAQRNLGYLYLKGKGVKKDKTEARTWLEKAAAQGDSYATELLKEIK